MDKTRTDTIAAERGATDSEVLAAVAKMLEERAKNMGEAIDREDYPHAEGTTARAWHVGYVSAMEDTLKMIRGRPETYPMTMFRRDREE